MPTNNYFQLRWNGGAVTRQYRLVLTDNKHAGRLNLTGYTENLDGYSLVVGVAFRPRMVEGLVFIAENQELMTPWGTRAELETAWAASDLEAQLWTDTTFWPAAWLGDWMPVHLDPLLTYWQIPILLRQKEPAAA